MTLNIHPAEGSRYSKKFDDRASAHRYVNDSYANGHIDKVEWGALFDKLSEPATSPKKAMSNTVWKIELEQLPNGEFSGTVRENGEVLVEAFGITHPQPDWLLSYLAGCVVSKVFGSPMKTLTAYLKAAIPKKKAKPKPGEAPSEDGE